MVREMAETEGLEPPDRLVTGRTAFEAGTLPIRNNVSKMEESKGIEPSDPVTGHLFSKEAPGTNAGRTLQELMMAEAVGLEPTGRRLRRPRRFQDGPLVRLGPPPC